MEAKWYYSGHKPSIQEYLENAWITIGAPVILAHAFFCVTNPIGEKALECMEEYPNILRQSSILLRLNNDLGTSPVSQNYDPKYLHYGFLVQQSYTIMCFLVFGN